MSSSSRVRLRDFVDRWILSALAFAALALAADFASAQTARQRATFAVQGTTVIGLTGETTGVLNDDNPTSSKRHDQLSPQAIFGFEVGYTGTVTADISFDIASHTITGIHVASANLVAGADSEWVPGNWDGSTFGTGTTAEAANYGGTVAGLINFATRGLTMNLSNHGAVFPVAPGGNFTVTAAQKAQFTSGNLAAYSAYNAGSTIDSNDALASYKGVEVDTAAVQPATFTYLDDMDMPQELANPLAGQPYPSGVVWRYVESNTDVPVFDSNGQPILDGNMNQLTTNVRTYGDLAPGYETTKGGLQAGINPPDVDKHWFQPFDGELHKPDVAETYVDSDVWFDAMGVPLKVRADLDLPNTGVNLKNVVYDAFGNIISSTPVSSNITASLNAETGKYDANLAMNLDAAARVFLGDFVATLNFGQAKDIFDELIDDTGRIFADAALSLKAGDVNNDGLVNIFDINLVSSNWSPKTHPDYYAGDANSDGSVDIFDINLVSANWSSTPAAAVPEPSTLLLAAVGGALGLGLRRRRRQHIRV
jgi:Dockerin type I domain/PEP-CTERM motif